VTVAVTLNGWPYPAKRIIRIQVPGTKRFLNVNQDCAPLLAAVAADYHKFIRPIDVGSVDDAGYADRDARGASGRKSNHANGTAIDLNWSREGAQGSNWGARLFATAKGRAGLALIKRRYGSVIQWGGDWRAKDYMHFELKPGSDARRVAALCKRQGINSAGVRTRDGK